MTAIKVQKTLFYSFKRHINAFAAVLYDYEAEEITSEIINPQIRQAFLSPLGFRLSANDNFNKCRASVHKSSMWNKAGFREDTISANLDTGKFPKKASALFTSR